jgi:hypothetical protein
LSAIPPKRGVQVSEEKFLSDALNLVETAQKRNVALRILGGFGIFIHSNHSPEAVHLQRTLGRLGEGEATFTDLDLGAHSKQSKQIGNFLTKELKYHEDMMTNALYGGRRMVFFHPTDSYQVDIFYDKLEFSHVISFGKFPDESRLLKDYPTLPLADLMLEKLQIHDINRKDLVDLIVLFRAHDVGEPNGNSVIDAPYIANKLSDEWGFWYDATNNLKSTIALAESCLKENKLDHESFSLVKRRLEKLLSRIEEEPKTPKWKARAKVGTAKKWYTDVGEL